VNVASGIKCDMIITVKYDMTLAIKVGTKKKNKPPSTYWDWELP
jgi:hypothetical protein